jgi:hypothetical protein
MKVPIGTKHLPATVKLLIVGVSLCATTNAGTIASVISSSNCCGAAVNVGQALQISWTQSQSYSDVEISVPLYSWTNNAVFHVDAFLTTTSGSSSAPPPIASTSVSFSTPFGSPADTELFSGLLLDPGTYYLTLFGSDPDAGNAGAIWVGEEASGPLPTITTASGSTISGAYFSDGGILDATYAPASSFITSAGGVSYYDVTITGDAIPEPATSMLVAGPIVVLLWIRLRKRGHRSCDPARS